MNRAAGIPDVTSLYEPWYYVGQKHKLPFKKGTLSENFTLAFSFGPITLFFVVELQIKDNFRRRKKDVRDEQIK